MWHECRMPQRLLGAFVPGMRAAEQLRDDRIWDGLLPSYCTAAQKEMIARVCHGKQRKGSRGKTAGKFCRGWRMKDTDGVYGGTARWEGDSRPSLRPLLSVRALPVAARGAKPETESGRGAFSSETCLGHWQAGCPPVTACKHCTGCVSCKRWLGETLEEQRKAWTRHC